MKSKSALQAKEQIRFDPMKKQHGTGSKQTYTDPELANPDDVDGGDDDDDDDDGDFEDVASIDQDLIYREDNNESGNLFMDAEEEDVVMKFLNPENGSNRTLADIIMEKLQEKQNGNNVSSYEMVTDVPSVPQKVIDVYVSVGKLLHHYRSGKLPKALKMLPHLKNWEYVLWLTRPDLWSPAGTFAVTRIFASNLNANMAQRYFNLVLLEKCREDIRNNNKLNYHLYLSLKKALFKPGAFYKGLLIPLVQSGTCTLREATIVGSVLSKVSIPGIHSAAALLRISEMPYYGSTSLFVKVLLQKKYALPQRVVDAVVNHFSAFVEDSRTLPVIWHQSLLVFVQRYKNELTPQQIQVFLLLVKSHSHHDITQEIRRELSSRGK